MSAQPDPQAGNGNAPATDTDQQETREWMDALSAVIDKEGAERAHYLLEQLLEHARPKVAIWVATSAPLPRWPACLARASTISGMPRARTTAVTCFTSRAMYRPVFMPAPTWKAA